MFVFRPRHFQPFQCCDCPHACLEQYHTAIAGDIFEWNMQYRPILTYWYMRWSKENHLPNLPLCLTANCGFPALLLLVSARPLLWSLKNLRCIEFEVASFCWRKHGGSSQDLTDLQNNSSRLIFIYLKKLASAKTWKNPSTVGGTRSTQTLKEPHSINKHKKVGRKSDSFWFHTQKSYGWTLELYNCVTLKIQPWSEVNTIGVFSSPFSASVPSLELFWP